MANIQIVDKDNQPLRAGTMLEAWENGLHHQIVRIILADGKGNILLQKRGPDMEVHPDRWTDSASGHVDFQETPGAAAARELREELGIVTPLTYLATFLTNYQIEDKQINTFNIVYTGRWTQDEDLTTDPHEVADTKWIPYGELLADIERETPGYTPYLQEIIRSYGEMLGKQ